MHVFFLCIFVYSYLLDFYFFSQQDPIDNSTWYLGVILIKIFDDDDDAYY